MVQALFIVFHFFGVVKSEELQREMVKFQGSKENVNTRRSIFRLLFFLRDSKARKIRKHALKPLSARGRGSSRVIIFARNHVFRPFYYPLVVMTSFFGGGGGGLSKTPPIS